LESHTYKATTFKAQNAPNTQAIKITFLYEGVSYMNSSSIIIIIIINSSSSLYFPQVDRQ